MAVPSCFTDFAGALKDIDEMSEEGKAQLLNEVKTRSQARLEKRLMPKAKALNVSLEELLNERAIDQNISRKQSLLAIQKRIAAEKQIKEFPNLARGTFAWFGGVEGNVKAGRLSVAGKLLDDRQNAYAKFLKPIEQDSLVKTFNDKKNDREIGRAIWNKQHPDTKINKIGKAFLDYEEWQLGNYHAEGAFVGSADDRITNMVYNSERLQSATGHGLSDMALKTKLLAKNKGDYVAMNKEYVEAAYQRFRNLAIGKLNDEKTFENVPDSEKEDFIRGAYEGMVTGIHKVPYTEQGSPALTGTGSNLGKKLSKGRVLFWNNGDAWMDINETYGFGNVHDAILNEIESGAKHLTVLKTMGTSPKIFVDRLLNRMQKQSRDLATNKRNQKYFTNARNVAEAIIGDQNRVDDGMLGKMINAMRMASYLTKMGNITESSIPDLGVMISACRQHHIPAVEVMKEALTNFTHGMPKDEKLQLWLDLGVYSKGSIGGIMSKVGNIDSPGYMFAKGMKTVDKLTLINSWDSLNRGTMGTVISRNTARSLKTDFDNLHESQRRTLEISGIDKPIWELLQKHQDKLATIDRQKYLTPQIVHEFSDEDLKAFGKVLNPDRKKFTQEYLDRVRGELRQRLGVFFTDQSAYGKVFPNAADMALMNFGVKNGTLPGRVWQLITMFKSFHIAMLRRTYGRFIYGNGADSIYDSLFHGKADYSGMIHFMMGQMPWQYISMAAGSLSRGLTAPSLDDRKTWEELFARSVVPLYGSIMQLANADSTVSGLSPALGTLEDAGKLIKSVMAGKNAANQATWFAQHNVPVINTFYTGIFLNRGIWDHIHSNIDPGYSIKAQDRAKQRGQSYWWKPT